jgi:hypothetical protein
MRCLRLVKYPGSRKGESKKLKENKLLSAATCALGKGEAESSVLSPSTSVPRFFAGRSWNVTHAPTL